jgi:hypothetical protein
MSNIAEQFDHLAKVIASEDFLHQRSLGGEIPFFVSTYNVADEDAICQAIKGLKNRLETQGIPVLVINLYELAIEILNRELGEGVIFEMEQDMDKTEFREALESVLDIREVLMPSIREKIQQNPAKVYFLTGIGNAYPFIRSHNVLNNLQTVAKDAPTVAFYPGNYSGTSFELFGLLRDENYYRAFNMSQIRYKPN